MPPRFLTLTDLAETLNITMAQAKALVRSGDLPAIKVGGRGAWRIEAVQLEAYIERAYARTRAQLKGAATASGRESTPASAPKSG